MQRKQTLGYGTQAALAHEAPASSPPRSLPSSSPPSGIRLARPDVPRPSQSSIPPSAAAPQSRSSAPKPAPMAPANGNATAAATARAIAAIAASIPPPPPSGLRARSSAPPAPPRPASVKPTAAPEEMMLGDDEVTYVPDEGEPAEAVAPRPPSRRPPPVTVPSLRSTGQNWPLVAPLALAPPPRVPTFGPAPSSVRPEPASSAGPSLEAPVEQPVPSTPPLAPIPWVSLTPPPPPPADLAEVAWVQDEPSAIEPGVIEPAASSMGAHSMDLDEPVELPFLSPAAVLRERIVAAWQNASPNVRGALTFGAGVLVGALGVAIA